MKKILLLGSASAVAIAFLYVCLALFCIGIMSGCSWNRPVLRSETHHPDGTVEIRVMKIATFAIWPAETDLAKQRATLSDKSFLVGTEGLKESGGGTNMVEALKALDSILGKVRP